MHYPRKLLVTADDFGIGPETSLGILELGAAGVVTSTVMLVNSPYAEEAVAQWRRAGARLEIGWHPCLTMDRPLLPAERVPSLVNAEGKFQSLGQFLLKLIRGKINEAEVLAELTAQYQRFIELMGTVPFNINGHHHVHIFGPVRRSLLQILHTQQLRPYVRRVREPWQTLRKVPGIRLKRWLMTQLGTRSISEQIQVGLPGAEWLIGITDPPYMEATNFFTRWLAHSPGAVVELMVHPGHDDVTLLGRDATPHNGQRERRVQEWYRLHSPGFREAVAQHGFSLVTAQELMLNAGQVHRQAA